MKRYIVLDGNNVITTEILTNTPINKVGVYESEIGNLGDTVSIMQNGVVVVTSEYRPLQPELNVISKLEFLKRFSQAERIDIRSARMASPELDDFMELLNSAQSVDLNDLTLAAGMNTLVQAGLLTSDRKNTIMSAS